MAIPICRCSSLIISSVMYSLLQAAFPRACSTQRSSSAVNPSLASPHARYARIFRTPASTADACARQLKNTVCVPSVYAVPSFSANVFRTVYTASPSLNGSNRHRNTIQLSFSLPTASPAFSISRSSALW